MADSKKLKNFRALKKPRERELIRECITKIMNTLSFRKLAGKTQVILSLTGPDVRTRLTHTIEVAKIAKDICISLGLNEELADAMALAHDIGHTPFGHVGEQTLREIMCGCDTLGDKVRDCDFDNSGFKHNLQSFRVLKELECIADDKEYKKIWPYILWGVLAHTDMTYAKAYSGMDDEIFISSKHCVWVYVCHYDDKKECKRNIQKKKEKEKEVEKKEICKPWYCAKLPVIKDREKIDEKLLNKNNNETRREYIKKEPIKEKYLEWIYCSHKCYLAKLWKHKIANANKSIYKTHPYLFDHPFPNSFYAASLNNYFSNTVNGNNLGFVSFEAQIVSQADEIAQRQQEFEDGINKGLLPFETAKENVGFLIEEFNCRGSFKKIIDDYKKINNSKKLGKLLANFYKKALIHQTEQNVTDFVSNADKVQINIYSLMNILYSMDDDNDKKEKWILKEFEALDESSKFEKFDKIECLRDYFEINFYHDYSNHGYLYLLSYDHLEKCTKRGEHFEEDKIDTMIVIMSKCIGSLCFEYYKQVEEQTEELCESGAKDLFKLKNDLEVLKNNSSDRFEFAYRFTRTLDLLRNYLFKHYQKESADFFKMKNKQWVNIGWLKLRPFYSLYKIFAKNFKTNNGLIITISDLKNFKAPTDFKPEDHAGKTFKNWKELLKDDANKVLANLVAFTDKNNLDDNREKALDDFKEKQNKTILKSEPVEKNDGKASYILRRLFKAYITNSHQLPDLGLMYILISLITLIRVGKLTELLKSEKKACKEILDKLKKTMIDSARTNDELKKIWETGLLDFETEDKEFDKLERGKSSEIKAALGKRKKLSSYFKELNKKQVEINKKLDSEKEEDKIFIKEQLRNLRAVLDNSILNKTLYWESILTRGICDYIASLTDQEAINEYEKLYAGIMELV